MPKVEVGYPSHLTASDISLLIDLYWSPEAREQHTSSEGPYGLICFHEDLVRLISEDLVHVNADLTPRGEAYVRHLLNQPLPELYWRMPSTPSPV